MSEFSKGFKSRRPNKSFYDPAFASGWWVYGTLILSWCLDLLPLSHSELFGSDSGFLDDPSAAAHLLLAGISFRSADRRRYRSSVRTACAYLLHGSFLYGIDERAPELVKQHCAVHLLDSYFLYSRDSSDD